MASAVGLTHAATVVRPPPRLHHIQVNDVGNRLAVTEWLPAPAQPSAGRTQTCVFLHATGFHSRCWDQTIANLPPTVHIYAIDARGHGQSDKPAPKSGFYSWVDMSDEVVTVLRHLGVRRAIGIGHSMGGFLVLHAALQEAEFFSALLLVDPVVSREERYSLWEAPDVNAPDTMPFITRRFNKFASADDMYNRLRTKVAYTSWTDACLVDYCKFGLVQSSSSQTTSGWSAPSEVTDDGLHQPSLELACPPALEAATYKGSGQRNERQLYQQLAMPVVILRAEISTVIGQGGSTTGNFSNSPTDPDAWRLFADARDVHLKNGMTHFIPMQDPLLVASHVTELLQITFDPVSVPRASKL